MSKIFDLSSISLDPIDEEIFATIALCYQHQNNYEDAVVFYKKAISIKPDYAMAHQNLSFVLLRLLRLENFYYLMPIASTQKFLLSQKV